MPRGRPRTLRHQRGGGTAGNNRLPVAALLETDVSVIRLRTQAPVVLLVFIGAQRFLMRGIRPGLLGGEGQIGRGFFRIGGGAGLIDLNGSARSLVGYRWRAGQLKAIERSNGSHTLSDYRSAFMN